MTTQEPIIRLPGGYRLVKELPIADLPRDHRRLKVFFHKGNKCSCCGVVCDRLIIGKAKDGARHIDLYSQDLNRLLTVGHIIPASAGGLFKLDNLRPLCHKCNSAEGNHFRHVVKEPELFDSHCKGRLVYKKNRTNFIDGEFFAVIAKAVLCGPRVNFVFTNGQEYPAMQVKFVP